MAAPPARIGIVGAGRLGSSLAAALHAAGYRVVAVARRRDSFAPVPDGAKFEVTTSPSRVVDVSDAVFLTVPDGEIERTARELPWRAGQWAIHCSGALGRGALSVAAEAGALTGTLHPLQSFPSREPEAERFRGIVCGIEGEGPLGEFLDEAVRAIGARPVRLEGVDRALYHAAAVMVNNHAVALAAAATRIWIAAGLPAAEARHALSPLVLAAAQNIGRLELADALTGPVARGDLETVARHLAALAPFPELRELYRRLSLELTVLPLGHDAGALDAMRRLLQQPEPTSG